MSARRAHWLFNCIYGPLMLGNIPKRMCYVSFFTFSLTSFSWIFSKGGSVLPTTSPAMTLFRPLGHFKTILMKRIHVFCLKNDFDEKNSRFFVSKKILMKIIHVFWSHFISGSNLRGRDDRLVHPHFRLRRKSETLGHFDRTLHPRRRVAQEGVPYEHQRHRNVARRSFALEKRRSLHRRVFHQLRGRRRQWEQESVEAKKTES